jgi:NADH dehydrogenase
MASEQVSGEHMDARTDIYAFGAALYEMATRQHPFREDSTPRLFDSILHQPVVPPRALNPRISPEMERIILKCLEKDPGERYQSAKEVVVDLRPLLAPTATSVSSALPARTNKWKWWAPAVAGAVLLLLLAIALAFDLGGIRWRMGGHRTALIRSIAVLPLENLSHDAAQKYSAARGLAGVPARVTLIDKRNYNLFRPMLYQVAAGVLSADQISGPLRSILSHQRNAEVLMDEVTGIDTGRRVVHLRQREIPYDYLILATGIQYNYFGHDEWRRVAPGLESLDDADLIRGKILLAFERAEEMAALGLADREAIRQHLTFVLVGAGTVGVEMSSTLAEMSRMALAHDFRHIDTRSAQILLYEAASRVLPTYPEGLSTKAQRHLESLGVKVFTNTRVTSVDADGMVANGQRIRSSTVLWGAGVLASPAGHWLGAAMDKSGKIIVNSDLSVPGHPEIFAIGDTAHVAALSRNLLGIKSKESMDMPGVAQPAIQEGRYVAALIRRRVTGQPPPAPFWYWDKGDLAIVGRIVRGRRSSSSAVHGISGEGCLGSCAHLFSHWVREPVLRHPAMGNDVSD